MRSHRFTQRGMWIYPLPHISLWFHTTLVWHPESGPIAQLALYTCNTKRRRRRKKSMHWCSAEPCTLRQITAMLLKHAQNYLFNDTSGQGCDWWGRPSPCPFKVKRNYWLFKLIESHQTSANFGSGSTEKQQNLFGVLPSNPVPSNTYVRSKYYFFPLSPCKGRLTSSQTALIPPSRPLFDRRSCPHAAISEYIF